MAQERRKVSLLFHNDSGWIAGTYYILNLVNALKVLPDGQKPHLVIISKKADDMQLVKDTGYPYLSYLPLEVSYSITDRLINKASRALSGKNRINRKYTDAQLGTVFPYSLHYSLSDSTSRLYWIPDFQEKYFPQFFTGQEKAERQKGLESIAAAANRIVFSSRNAQEDFQKFFPGNKCSTHVVHFAATHPEYSSLDLAALRTKFGLGENYFISPNQFWEHKNHIVVLKALKQLKGQGVSCQVAFTGKERDHRNPDYFDRLKAFVKENELDDQVRFLGFIDRREQLKLMEGALAVIQPSLFEGWSTVVEDAKAMSRYVLLSDIPVHREQLGHNVSFFDPRNEDALALLMSQSLESSLKSSFFDYNDNVREFAQSFALLLHL